MSQRTNPPHPRAFNPARLLKLLVLSSLFSALFPAAHAQQDAARADRPTPRFGGDHEFGFLAGLSPHGGPIWGYDQNVRYVPVLLRYSYLIAQHPAWSLRYSPEITALSVLYEKPHSPTNPAAPVYDLGAGISPEGFELDLRPAHRIEPFFSNDGGFIYYDHHVLSPQGSQFMYTIDFGAGVHIFQSRRNAVTIGFRYQHLSNANISLHNPGTDAQTFYVGFSHFHTSGVP